MYKIGRHWAVLVFLGLVVRLAVLLSRRCTGRAGLRQLEAKKHLGRKHFTGKHFGKESSLQSNRKLLH